MSKPVFAGRELLKRTKVRAIASSRLNTDCVFVSSSLSARFHLVCVIRFLASPHRTSAHEGAAIAAKIFPFRRGIQLKTRELFTAKDAIRRILARDARTISLASCTAM